MISEEWREIEGFQFYEVSSLGNVRSWKFNRWGRAKTPRLLRPGIAKNGYPLVVLHGVKANGRWFQRSTYVHRLVAEAFIGPRPEGHEVNHINSQRADPRACNLEYVTSSQNNTHAIRFGRMKPPPVRIGPANNKTKLSADDVRLIRSSADTCTALAARLKCSIANVSDIRRGRTWRHVS